MTSSKLGRIHVTGFASLRDVTLELPTDVTVIIGANGSGKSNLVGALELISQVWEANLQDTVLKRGGFDRLVHKTPRAEDQPEAIRLEVWGAPDPLGLVNGYRAELSAAEDDQAVLRESVFIHDTSKYRDPYEERLGTARESSLAKRKVNQRLESFLGYVRPLLEGIRVYHFDDVSADAPTKKLRSVDDDVTLHSDAGNLAPYLLRLRTEHPDAYARIVTVVRNVAPFFDDFVLNPTSAGVVRLRWRQRGVGDVTFGAGQLSDGTLRFACLATLLLSPDAPPIIVLDEPELGLHPFAVVQLAALIRQATVSGRQALVATQSPLLLDQFPVEAVALLDRRDGATVVTRPDPTELGVFLDDYSLSDLWQMNILAGGQPAWEESRA